MTPMGKLELGVFLPIGNNGFLMSTTAPQYAPSFEMNKQISVLADMGLPSGARLLSLLAFNLGIEAGQLAVVLAVMPVVYQLRAGRLYRNAVLPWGSAAIAGLALVWLVQRAAGWA